MALALSVQNPTQGFADENKSASAQSKGWRTRFSSVFRPPSSAPHIGRVLGCALFISLVLLLVPMAAPDLEVDSSWCGVLKWAHGHGLQFGKEILFTYGPLGYLIAPYTFVAPSSWLILINALFCFHVSLGLCLVAGRMPWAWRCLFLGLFVVEAANTDLRADLALQVGLFSWGLLCLVESGNRQKLSIAGFVLILAFGAMAKVVYLFVAGFSVAAIALGLFTGGQRRLILILWTSFAGIFLLGWVTSGQAISNLGPYVLNGLSISRGYDQAAALEGLPALRVWGMALGITAVAGVLFGVYHVFEPSLNRTNWRRAVLLTWLLGLLFLAWKHSLVRLDRPHFMDLAVLAPIITLGLEAIPGAKPRRGVRALAVVCCAVSFLAMQSTFMPGITSSFRQVISQFYFHTQWLVNPGHCRDIMTKDLQATRDEAQLPKLRQIIGDSTVDVLGSHQSYALLNGLNYHPRPVFQSYAAYSPELAKRNELFYISRQAPDFVLVELTALEHRFPALNDGQALRAILINYHSVAAEGPFVLFQRQSGEPARLTLLKEGILDRVDPIDMRPYSGENLWLEVDVEPTLSGRLCKFFYRLPAMRLSVWEDTPALGKKPLRRRTSPSVLRMGFLASPFLVNSQDLINFCDAGPVRRPVAFSIETEGAEPFWNQRTRFRLFRIENRLCHKMSK